MGGSTLICLLMSTVVLFLLMIPHSVSTDGGTQARINQVCRATEDFSFCRDVFNKYLYNDVTDFKGLTQIALTQTLEYASDTRIFIQRSEQNAKNINIRNLFKICDIGYGILMNQFEDANLAFASGDYRSMMFDIEKCDRFVNDCQFVLGTKVSELHEKNSHTKVLVRMSVVSGGLIGTED